MVGGGSIRLIAVTLGRAAVDGESRDRASNGGRLRYRANRADQAAWESGAAARRSCKLVQKRELALDRGLEPEEALVSPSRLPGG